MFDPMDKVDTKADSRPAKITPEHREEAARLKAIWDAKKGSPNFPTQEKFATEYGIGSQSAVWRFLNGRDPLSPKAARGFAKGLGCNISDFSPRLANQLSSYTPYIGSDELDLSRLNKDEFVLIQMFRQLPEREKLEMKQTANDLYVKAHPKVRSIANPYPQPPGPPPEVTPADKQTWQKSTGTDALFGADNAAEKNNKGGKQSP